MMDCVHFDYCSHFKADPCGECDATEKEIWKWAEGEYIDNKLKGKGK